MTAKTLTPLASAMEIKFELSFHNQGGTIFWMIRMGKMTTNWTATKISQNGNRFYFNFRGFPIALKFCAKVSIYWKAHSDSF